MTDAFMNYDAAQTPPDLGDPTATFTLACDDNAPRVARQAVNDLCRGRNGGSIADAGLVVSELVTNAVLHTRSDEIVVSLWIDGTTIDGRVWDGGSGFTPRPGSASEAGVGGHGLGVVDAVVESWGSRRVPSSVWFRSAMA
jgi:anti-sigma regulatory factor (Ser/Thr protein kinase)